ncbi:MAG: hypothetical protein CMF39_03200, partial [Legionellaceae bacterium]|nr:hypothetical protein [Legionellaceae bacterium]
SEPEDDIVGEVRSVGRETSRETASVGEQAILQEEIALAEPAVEPTPVVETVQPVQQAAQLGPLVQEGFVMLHLKSSYEEGMGGYTLLQTLLANHLQFGAKQFFHCYENNNPKAKVLFSVSSDEAPGTFNPTAMRDFNCQGLMLFMNAEHHKQPLRVFEAMLDTAESLAEALDADVFINQDQPCDEAHLAQLRSELK